MINNSMAALIIFVSGVLGFYSSAVHASLADQIFNDSGIETIKISPNGQKLAILNRDTDALTLAIQEVQNQKTLFEYDVRNEAEQRYLQNYTWIDDRFIAMEITESIQGIGDLADSKIHRRLYFIDSLNLGAAPREMRTKGRFSHPLPNVAGKFVFQTAGIASSLYTIDVNQLADKNTILGKLDLVDGGQVAKSNRISHIDQFAMRWFLTDLGEPQAVLTSNRKGVIELREFGTDGNTNLLESWDFTEKKKQKKDKTSANKPIYVPFAKAINVDEYYTVDLNEEPTTSIYLENYKTKNRTKIFTSEGHKILDLILSEEGHFIGARIIANDRIQYRYTNGNSVDLAATDSQHVISTSLDGQNKIVLQSSFNHPGLFSLVTGKQKPSTTTLGFRNSALKAALGGTQLSGTVEVKGTPISYLLNLPKPRKTPHPLLVMPHGGPFEVFDSPYYNAEVQYWVAQNYAVLRVNFRGSGGKDQAFEDLGKQQYGTGMIEDIATVTQHIQQRADIQATKTCAFGMSYGGYAAMLLTLKYPERFTCAVSFAGITDLNLYLNSHALSDHLLSWAQEYIGDPKQNYQELKDQSPLYNFASLSRPWLIIQGADDSRVDAEHFYRLRQLNQYYNKPVEFLLLEKMSHNFENGEAALSVNRPTAEYLKRIFSGE